MTPSVRIIVLGARNTKGAELEYLQERIQAAGCAGVLVDTGLPPAQVGKADDKAELMQTRAGEIIGQLPALAGTGVPVAYLAIGGGVGTWIALEVMKTLPLGAVKVLVTTMPFDLRPDLAQSDIIIVPPIVDIQGLNPSLRLALSRGVAIARALAMELPIANTGRKLVAITGLGITTDAVKQCQELLEVAGYEVATYHAAGYGSRAFERAVRQGAFAGIIDLTTHELNALLFGHIAVPEKTRLTAAAETGVPQVVCPGGLDILTRGPLHTLTPAELQRPHYRHSPEFTHLRATHDEMEQAARLLAGRVCVGRGPCAVMIPSAGFSRANRPGSPMADPAAMTAFTAVLRRELPASIALFEYPHHINDPEFARAAVRQLLALMASRT